jgi:hypothetical protein
MVLGYANKGLPSPYIWSGTDQYEKGKYTSDGKYDPAEAVDEQLGCAGILKFMGVFKNAPTGAGTAVAGGYGGRWCGCCYCQLPLVELRRSTLAASASRCTIGIGTVADLRYRTL